MYTNIYANTEYPAGHHPHQRSLFEFQDNFLYTFFPFCFCLFVCPSEYQNNVIREDLARKYGRGYSLFPSEGGRPSQ